MQYLTAEVKTLSDDGTGTFEAVASAATLDRDGEVVATGAFAPLPDRVPIHRDHLMSSEGLVGSGQPFYAGDHLMVRGTFASTPRAQVVRQLVKEGHLGHMSVGFMAADRKDVDGVPHITRAELLEVSFVSVPSNREARVLAAKSGSKEATVSEARALVARTLLDIALADAQFVLQQTKRARPATSADAALADAKALIADLRRDRR